MYRDSQHAALICAACRVWDNGLPGACEQQEMRVYEYVRSPYTHSYTRISLQPKTTPAPVFPPSPD